MAYLIVYLAGVAIGLAAMRDRWPSRLAIALLWPLGPMAFLVVIAILAVAAIALWPIPVLGAATLLGLALWALF
jgi:hypothetical protein